LAGKLPESGFAVKGAVPEVEKVFWGMVDIEEDGVKSAAGIERIEAELWIGGEGEEIAVDKPAARVGCEFRPQGNQSRLMPFNDGLHEIDDQQGAHG